jgi:hypothetical protein
MDYFITQSACLDIITYSESQSLYLIIYTLNNENHNYFILLLFNDFQFAILLYIILYTKNGTYTKNLPLLSMVSFFMLQSKS